MVWPIHDENIIQDLCAPTMKIIVEIFFSLISTQLENKALMMGFTIVEWAKLNHHIDFQCIFIIINLFYIYIFWVVVGVVY